jgi:hypothetical protein
MKTGLPMQVLVTPLHGGKPVIMEDLIVELFCRIDEQMRDVPRHAQARLWPSELVTLAVLFAIKGDTQRAFYRWISGNWRPLFPGLPERTRLFRLIVQHQGWTRRFLASPTIFGIADTYGVELIHPRRQHRSTRQLGRKGLSNHRWIVGGKLAVVINRHGRVCAWDAGTANTHDSHFRPLIAGFCEQMIVLTDSSFHGVAGDPANMKVCRPGTWPCRWKVETVLSMLTGRCKLKRMRHRVWRYFQAHLAAAMAAWNLMLDHNPQGQLSIADFVL